MWKYVYPILTKWRDQTQERSKDAFQVQIDFYRDRYEEEFQAILRDGVEYDEDGGGTVSDSEKEPLHCLRFSSIMAVDVKVDVNAIAVTNLLKILQENKSRSYRNH